MSTGRVESRVLGRFYRDVSEGTMFDSELTRTLTSVRPARGEESRWEGTQLQGLEEHRSESFAGGMILSSAKFCAQSELVLI